jgi:tRNA G46 methylase TrmB
MRAMESAPNPIRHLSGKIAKLLGAPEAEVLRYIERGDMRVEHEPPPGFQPLMRTSEGQTIFANAQVRYRYMDYANQLELVRQERAAGRNNFFHVLNKLRAPTGDEKKTTLMEPQEIYGHQTVMQPYMGYRLRMRRDMSIPFHHFVLQHIVSEHMHAGLDVVFEIGAGIGDSIAELAARSPFNHIDFVAGEIALNGQRCLAEFADMLHLPNLRSVDFDITAPNFDFMKGKNVLVFSQFAMVYANPFPEQFFRQLAESAQTVTALLFEPFSFALADEFKIEPWFSRDRARRYGIAENLWDCIKAAESDGHIVIDEVIPDVAGKTAIVATSLVRFHKK